LAKQRIDQAPFDLDVICFGISLGPSSTITSPLTVTCRATIQIFRVTTRSDAG
jgi:hypothetical protein